MNSDDTDAVTIDDMIDEAEREVNYRRSVYGKLVAAHKMNRRLADRRIDVMLAIVERLKRGTLSPPPPPPLPSLPLKKGG